MSNEPRTYDVVVTRVFDAPVERVWQAWSDPADVKQWWGPDGFTAPVAEMDFREGGKSLVCMSSSQFGDLYSTWTYRTIRPLEQIDFVHEFANKDGEKIEPASLGLPPGIPSQVPQSVTFRTVDGNKTEMTVSEYGYTSEDVVAISRVGLEQCLDKIAALLASG
jgi:uncharacterized protein YndB with AHSA1/START domain